MPFQRSLEKVKMTAENYEFDLIFPLPLIRDRECKDWTWIGRKTEEGQRGPGPGTELIDSYQCGDLELSRHIWQPGEEDFLALQWTLANRGDHPIRLERFRLVSIQGITPFDEEKKVRLFRQGRLKNDCPELIDLMLSCPGQQEGKKGKEKLVSDPFLQLAIGKRDSQSQLFLGFLTMCSQLSGIEIDLTGPERTLDQLTAVCEMDGVEVYPGKKRASEWLGISWAHDLPHEVIREYTERVASIHGIDVDPSPPSVYLSWYYLRDSFSACDLEENLAFLADTPLPLDVIQIDDCWEKNYGDWLPNQSWPEGMEKAASGIRERGYTPGLWTCPYLAEIGSDLSACHPEWILRDGEGNEMTFRVNEKTSYVLDPTHPGVLSWLEELYRKLTKEWGFTYHKLDFMRAAVLNGEEEFHDTTCTRAEAYRKGLEAIRKGAGKEAYILVCGGLYGPSLGLADGQRTGSDVHGRWDEKTEKTLTQSLFRTWMGRLWHTDPDALMIRRREKPFRGEEMSLGFFDDSEARVLSLNQYLSGGVVSVSERLVDFDEDRLMLWRHLIPSLGCPAVPRDLYTADQFPAIYHTPVSPRAEGLTCWHTVALLNPDEEAFEFALTLDEQLLGTVGREKSCTFLIWDFFREEFLGCRRWREEIPTLEVPARDGRLLRITAWDGESPVLLGTNLHFSGGGVEIADWEAEKRRVSFTFHTAWSGKAAVWIAFAGRDGEPDIRRIEIDGPADHKEITVSAC